MTTTNYQIKPDSLVKALNEISEENGVLRRELALHRAIVEDLVEENRKAQAELDAYRNPPATSANPNVARAS